MARGIRGQYVRRYDSLGRPYYVPRGGGQRVKAALWKAEREQIAEQRQRGKTAVELGEVPPTGGPEGEPFPTSIGGIPVNELGVPEFEVYVDENGVEFPVSEGVEGEYEST